MRYLWHILRLLQIKRAYHKESTPPLPFSLTLGVTYRCNLFCKTCNVTPQRIEEMSLKEWEKVFHSFGGSIPWLTITGGEIFLRADILSLISLAVGKLKPAIVTLPTNGSLPQKIANTVESVARAFPDTFFIVNLSLDGPPELHNTIRKTNYGFKRLQETYFYLRKNKLKNVVLGIGSVISRSNIQHAHELLETVKRLKPDSFVFEPAQNRAELHNLNMRITPFPEDYHRVARYLYLGFSPRDCGGPSKIIRKMRHFYHPIAARILMEKRQILPCFAGVASCHIESSGWLWECCTDATPMGHLPSNHYDFPTLWRNFQAKKVRYKVKSRQCACPMSNIAYLNMALSPLQTIKQMKAMPL